ncbi:hypothetical protein BMS3Abin01_00676 [bacterium BMS3Abin01]|nr:hypothetical protein BMS3Abin01_00676 [bacterium BMS3Abin01]
MVTVFRQVGVQAPDLAVPGGQRPAEQIHLRAVVIDVELSGDLVPRELKDTPERITVGGVTGMARMQGTRRIGADELQQVVLGPGGPAAPEGVATGQS